MLAITRDNFKHNDVHSILLVRLWLDKILFKVKMVAVFQAPLRLAHKDHLVQQQMFLIINNYNEYNVKVVYHKLHNIFQVGVYLIIEVYIFFSFVTREKKSTFEIFLCRTTSKL